MFDMVKMMKKAMGVKSEMAKVKKGLSKKIVEASSSDGKVTVTATGDGKISQVKIEPSLVDTAQVAALEKSVAEAVSRALEEAGEVAAAEMAKLTEGLGLPPGMMP